MRELKIIDSGIVYSNPLHYLYARQAYFPSAVEVAPNELVVTMAVGEAFEASNIHVEITRSSDGGRTWDNPEMLESGENKLPTSECCRISRLKNGELIALFMLCDRSRKDMGFSNPENLGFVETDLYLMRSNDNGKTWSERQKVETPVQGPFELCCPVIELEDGRLLIITSTWNDWEGNCPDGIRMLTLISEDHGESWNKSVNVMKDDGPDCIHFWESKISELQDGRLLAVAWKYNKDTQCDDFNQYAISTDKGESYSKPMSMDLQGQTLTPMELCDGKILTIYRRMDKSGLWANISHLENTKWVNESELPLWGTEYSDLTSTSENMSKNFNVLKFGAPNIISLSDNTLFVTFWAVEDGIGNIRYIKLSYL